MHLQPRQSHGRCLAYFRRSDYKGYHTIRDGITYSMNIVALRCMADTVTPQLGVEYAERLGITSLVSQDQTLSTALGGLTKGVSNLELTNAFAAIANGGTLMKPYMIDHVENVGGQTVKKFLPSAYGTLMSANDAQFLTHLMSQVVEIGTGSAMRGSQVTTIILNLRPFRSA